jgi:hypothetical protein
LLCRLFKLTLRVERTRLICLVHHVLLARFGVVAGHGVGMFLWKNWNNEFASAGVI